MQNTQAALKAFKLLKEFLADRRQSRGGYAEFTEEDECKLHDLMIAIRDAKFGSDPDGDLPLEWKIINRQKVERSHFKGQPYTFKAKSLEEMMHALRIAQFNASVANSTLDVVFRSFEDFMKLDKQLPIA